MRLTLWLVPSPARQVCTGLYNRAPAAKPAYLLDAAAKSGRSDDVIWLQLIENKSLADLPPLTDHTAFLSACLVIYPYKPSFSIGFPSNNDGFLTIK